MDGYKENQRLKCLQNFKTVHVMAFKAFRDTLNNQKIKFVFFTNVKQRTCYSNCVILGEFQPTLETL